MASPNALLDRRVLLAGLGATAIAPSRAVRAAAQGRPRLALQAGTDSLALLAGAPLSPIWSLQGPELRFKRGDTVEIAFENALLVPAVLNWRGIDGIPTAEPLAARAPLAPGGRQAVELPLRHAGTFLGELGLVGDGQARPCRARALVVAETGPAAVDRDEVLLVEDWRVRADGTALAPGGDPGSATPTMTVNGRTTFEISARTNERVRLRFINGGQRTVIAIKVADFDVRVMAMDGQPAEPFPARNGALVLAPGGRVDAFIDVTAAAGSSAAILLHDGREARPVGKLVVANEPPARAAALPAAAPLPANGLPDRLDLKSALRVDLALGAPQAGWIPPAAFATTAAPAFRARAGRVVLLALTNRAAVATVFHLHGHHFRLLDRLDDGWKPFWLDTLAIEPGQTQRVAFQAEHAGRWLIESVATDWAAPRLVRWYSVE
ncbi:multicopper oxidase domain-containing protein [Bradyrhizobium sp.]|uniref:multicopper oxidase family protein n=1 Tax=Bradyrhizobium sp. TaxID=376 RepID=UPI0025C51D9A|nr:multicopper oxidase domain-containing protein [Bradyrhizobium sp.]